MIYNQMDTRFIKQIPSNLIATPLIFLKKFNTPPLLVIYLYIWPLLISSLPPSINNDRSLNMVLVTYI
jgi:hypothetical protein